MLSSRSCGAWFAAMGVLCGSLFWGVAARAQVDSPPAAAATPLDRLKVHKGFKAELLYSVPQPTQGSWVNMTFDPKGRLIVSDQYGKLYRVSLPPIGATEPLGVEPIDVEV